MAWSLATLAAGSADEFLVDDYGAIGDGETVCTEAIQEAIDAAAEDEDGKVTFGQGTYMSGAVFVKSGVEFHLPEGAVIKAINDDSLYPERPTRVAGIEMVWPTALVNVYQQSDVEITGTGVIDGNGKYWWHKFWGEDGESGMLADYEERGLRWAVDYDCKRVRALAVYESEDVEIHDVAVHRSGFWSVTLTYCERVKVDGVKIRANIGGYGPSSDGVDIDSCRDVLVQNCDIDCNDDNICLKAGRDADGLRVDRPCENIRIRDCVTRSGHGMVTLGSETSGGIRDVHVSNITAYGTANGIRIKSAKVRGGVLEDIRFEDIEMHGVGNPLHFELNWYPSYSYPTLPDDIDEDEIPRHWKVLTTRVEPPERGVPTVRDLTISGLRATGARQAMYANAYEEKPMRDVRLENVEIAARTAGSIRNAADWTMEDVTLRLVEDGGLEFEDTNGVPRPEIERISAEELGADEFSEEEKKGAVRLGLDEEKNPDGEADGEEE